MRTRRISMVVTVAALMVAIAAPAALAGPPESVFEDNNATWACAEEGDLPDGHCINARGQGSTGIILVFEDGFGPAESYSTNPQAANRACPHDEVASDGTWWDAIPNTLWVCHH